MKSVAWPCVSHVIWLCCHSRVYDDPRQHGSFDQRYRLHGAFVCWATQHMQVKSIIGASHEIIYLRTRGRPGKKTNQCASEVYRRNVSTALQRPETDPTGHRIARSWDGLRSSDCSRQEPVGKETINEAGKTGGDSRQSSIQRQPNVGIFRGRIN